MTHFELIDNRLIKKCQLYLEDQFVVPLQDYVHIFHDIPFILYEWHVLSMEVQPLTPFHIYGLS